MLNSKKLTGEISEGARRFNLDLQKAYLVQLHFRGLLHTQRCETRMSMAYANGHSNIHENSAISESSRTQFLNKCPFCWRVETYEWKSSSGKSDLAIEMIEGNKVN